MGRYYGVNESTVCYIFCFFKEKVIRESVVASAEPSTKVVNQVMEVHIKAMEKALNVWFVFSQSLWFCVVLARTMPRKTCLK